MPQRFRVTYATLSAANEDLHIAYDEGLALARSCRAGGRNGCAMAIHTVVPPRQVPIS